jgi:hypothetical protein
MIFVERAPFDIYAGRLLTLSAYLEQLAPERFDFGTFVGPDWGGAQDLSCGCTACGMGHAVVLFGEECDVEFIRTRFGAIPALKGTAFMAHDEITAQAGAFMFNIAEDDFDHLFIPGDALAGRLRKSATAKELAAHIQKFVRERYAEPALNPVGGSDA